MSEDSQLEGRRRPVSTRLEYLLKQSSHNSIPPPPNSFSPRRDSSQAMHRTRTPPNLSLATAAIRPLRATPSPVSMSPDEPQTQSSQFPILRWFGDWSRSPLHSRTPSRSPSASPSRSSCSSPPSPSLASLNEALREPLLPSFPPSARLPDPFYTTRHLLRPPPFLDNLARSTLPTSSLSFPAQHNVSTPHDLPPIVLTHSPPTRSSLDALRSVCTSATPTPDSASSVNWWWFQSETQNNVDSLLSEDDRADTAQQAQDNLKRKYRSPKNPIVFCHGLLGFDSVTIGPAIAPLQVTHWRGIKEVLQANGAEVFITRVPATSSPVDRAKVLEETISEVYPGRSVHLIGHSMGGLDCRYLTTHLTNRKFNVLSITTIATPHRGSSFADHFLATIGPTRMPSVLSLLDLLPNGGGDGKAFESLTVENMRRFNEETPDVEGVKYFSWGAVYEPGLIDTWKWPHSVILAREGPNDGLVSVESSKWGTYLGTLSQVNHLDLVGWVNTARYKWAEIMGKEINFHPATFYLGVADMLAGEVEGQIRKDEEECRGVETRLGTKVGKGADLSEGKEGDEGDQCISTQLRTAERGEGKCRDAGVSEAAEVDRQTEAVEDGSPAKMVESVSEIEDSGRAYGDSRTRKPLR